MNRALCFGLLFACVLLACDARKAEEREWTFINYYATHNNLERYTFRDLNTWTSSPKITRAVTSQWLLDTTTQGSYRVSMDGSTWNAPPGLVFTHVTHPNMSDPAVLAAHIKRVVHDFPAKNYAFWYSGHSRGWYTIPEEKHDDDGNEVPIWLSVTAIKNALVASRVKFELVTFDSCLMSMMETAYELRNVTRYLLAYETWGPWEGYMSNKTVELFQNKAVPTVKKLELLVDSFIARNMPETTPPEELETADAVVADLSHVHELGVFVKDLKLTSAEYKYSNLSHNWVDVGVYDLYQVVTSLPRLSAEQRQKFIRLFYAVVVYYRQNSGVPRNMTNLEPGSEYYNPNHFGLSVVRSLKNWTDVAPAYRELELQLVNEKRKLLRSTGGGGGGADSDSAGAGEHQPLPPRPNRQRFRSARGRESTRIVEPRNRRDNFFPAPQIEAVAPAPESAAEWLESGPAELPSSPSPSPAPVHSSSQPPVSAPLPASTSLAVVYAFATAVAAAAGYLVWRWKCRSDAGYEPISDSGRASG